MNYYAVERSTDHFKHYGIKGMRWGVRKAIEKGNNKALARQYKKAAKKLAKLNKRADIEVQSANANKYNKIAKIAGKIGGVGAGLAVVGTGTDHTLHYINSLHKTITKNRIADLDRESAKAMDDHWDMFTYNTKQYNEGKISKDQWSKNDKAIVQSHTDAQNKIGREYDNVVNDFNKGKDARKTAAEIGRYVGYAGAGIGVAGLGTAVIAKGKAMTAKKLTTANGHAKAVAQRDAWKREMNSAFKGTQYDASTGSIKRRKSK